MGEFVNVRTTDAVNVPPSGITKDLGGLHEFTDASIYSCDPFTLQEITVSCRRH